MYDESAKDCERLFAPIASDDKAGTVDKNLAHDMK